LGFATVVEYVADHFCGFDIGVVRPRGPEITWWDALGVDEVYELLLISLRPAETQLPAGQIVGSSVSLSVVALFDEANPPQLVDISKMKGPPRGESGADRQKPQGPFVDVVSVVEKSPEPEGDDARRPSSRSLRTRRGPRSEERARTHQAVNDRVDHVERAGVERPDQAADRVRNAGSRDV
jgi:hypothetical protein